MMNKATLPAASHEYYTYLWEHQSDHEKEQLIAAADLLYGEPVSKAVKESLLPGKEAFDKLSFKETVQYWEAYYR